MLLRDVCRILGYYLLGLTLTLLIPFFAAAYYEFVIPEQHPQPHSTIYFFWTIVISILLSYGCYRIGKKSSKHLYRREGLLAVVIIWFLTPAIAGLPFFISGTLENPFHAYFEAASGFTTTGATTMQAKQYDPGTGKEIPLRKEFCGVHDKVYIYWGTIKPVKDPDTGEILHSGIEAVSKALLLWRSFTQWLGGMGIVVLFVAILPALGVGGKMLLQHEVPGPIKDSLTPRIKESALQLWKIYLGLTVLQIIILAGVNPKMSWLAIFTVTFSTMSTGGFTIYNSSIGYFDSPVTEWVVMIFMVLAGINFALYFFSLRGKFYRLYEPEFVLYLLIILFGGLLTGWFIAGTPKLLMSGEIVGLFGDQEAFRYGFFQLISAMTTTGFVTTSYEYWPYAVQVLMLIVMYIGGMSGSTAGGMKVVRFFMLFRISQFKVESLFRPETVRRFRVGDRDVDVGSALMVTTFFAIVIAIAAFGTFFFVIDGLDPETSLSLVTLLVNNIGIGFRMTSPSESLAFLSDYGIVISSLLMIFGRLEFLAVLAVLVPAFWRHTK